MKVTATQVIKDLKKIAKPQKAKILAKFFKTGTGQYGEGDIFWGIMVPQQRNVVKKFQDLPLTEIKKLLSHKVHEVRLTGVLILVDQFEKADVKQRKNLYQFYLANSQGINNWDLVDLSAPRVVGMYLVEHPSEVAVLNKLVKSKNLWQRRIAILASWAFIRQGKFDLTLGLVKTLLSDPHDLMHKAAGWMLREVGKQNQKVLEKFLDQYAVKLPRTALRYAIERLSPARRQYYLQK